MGPRYKNVKKKLLSKGIKGYMIREGVNLP